MMDYSKMTDRELDAAVAEKVMGWEVTPGNNYWHTIGQYDWKPSWRIREAWEVMDAAKQKGVSFDIHEPAKGTRCVLAFVGDQSFRVTNDNPARAICEAALRAVEVGK